MKNVNHPPYPPPVAGRHWQIRVLLVILLISLTPVALFAQETPVSTATPEVTVLQQHATPDGVNTTLQINVRKDAFLSSRQPDANFGGDGELRLGWSASVYEATRILIEFDIGAIPRNAVIHSAELNIFQLGVTPGGDGPMSYRAQFMRSNWDEFGVTWNNANYLGGDALPLGEVDGSVGWKKTDVTNLIKTWYSGARANYGLIVIGDESASANRMREFSARERSNAPYIVVDYTVVCDTRAPSARVESLPAFSPTEFLVTWSGTDSAPSGCKASGIATYDVEYRINGGGWHQWKNHTTATSNHFKDWAENGDFVELRSRATDHAGNVETFGDPQASTRIDTVPPSVVVNPLPATTVAQAFVVSWSGSDNLSGVAHYDVQWRENNGPWQMLLGETTQTAYQITGAQNGVTYDFRVRATDHVGNGDEWPNAPQASTTIAANAVATVAQFNPAILKPTAPVTTSFTVNWASSASASAPAVAYDIYYQYNGGRWQLWQNAPAPQTSAQFLYQQFGLGDGMYGFEVVAINSAGLREPQRFKAEAIMLVDLADAIQPYAYLPLITNERNVLAADISSSNSTEASPASTK